MKRVILALSFLVALAFITPYMVEAGDHRGNHEREYNHRGDSRHGNEAIWGITGFGLGLLLAPRYQEPVYVQPRYQTYEPAMCYHKFEYIDQWGRLMVGERYEPCQGR